MPLNPDGDLVEVIADSVRARSWATLTAQVYANSSELDGRRWASEFVRRRKDDAIRKSGAAANGRSAVPSMPKPTSMADAVRAIPVVKAQPDNFRVVVKAQQAKKRK